MGTLGIILIVIALLLSYAILHVSVYNKLQYFTTKLEHVEGLIDENLRAKYDLVIRAEDTIAQNLKSKKEYLKEYHDLKDQKISNFDLYRKLEEAENIILNLYNDHEELNDNENLKEIMKELKQTDDVLMAGVTYYNKHTSTLNIYLRKFPTNIISKFHHAKIRPFFDGKNMLDNDFEDFKL